MRYEQVREGVITHNAAAKATPVDADEISVADSADQWIAKRATLGSLKTSLLTNPKVNGIYDTNGRLAIALPAAVVADAVKDAVALDKKPRSRKKKAAETAEDAPQEVGSLEGEMTLQERLAANHIEVANSNAGSSPSIKAVGADANLNLDLAGKGTGTVRVSGNPVSTRVAVPGNAAATGLPGQWAADATAIYAYTGNGTTHTWVKSVAAAW